MSAKQSAVSRKKPHSDLTHYTNNKLSNVKNAIVIHSDYSKSKGGYTGKATSAVTIKD
ncbi:hypothetical protein F444_15033, partial [Phytophthora nicotianae P1976]